jgi:Tfp pilus assembly protein PilO
MKLALTPRDRRLLLWGGLAVILYILMDGILLPYYDSLSDASEKIEVNSRRVANYRKILGGQSSFQSAVEATTSELRAAEAGLLTNTADALASAEIQGLVKNLILSKGMTFRRSDSLPVRPVSPEYQKVATRVEFAGNIDQFVGLAGDLLSGPQVLFMEEMKIQPAAMANLKNKSINFNLTISGLKRAEASALSGGK